MSPEAQKAAEEGEVNAAPTAAEVEAKAKAEADKSVAEQAAAQAAAKEAAEVKSKEAGASAGHPAPEPAEARVHPAVAELEGVAAQVGHTIDISGCDSLQELPLRPVAVDDHGRLWSIVEVEGGRYLKLLGHVHR